MSKVLTDSEERETDAVFNKVKRSDLNDTLSSSDEEDLIKFRNVNTKTNVFT